MKILAQIHRAVQKRKHFKCFFGGGGFAKENFSTENNQNVLLNSNREKTMMMSWLMFHEIRLDEDLNFRVFNFFRYLLF
jgi:hypothetical protein